MGALDKPAWPVADRIGNPEFGFGRARESTQQKLADPMDQPTEEIGAMLAKGRLPTIVLRTTAAELVPISGQPKLVPVEGTELAYVANSPADIFVHHNTDWYVLLSGRWFSAGSLKGPWSHVDSGKLPSDFRAIPADSVKSAVLASIAGTPEAREALIANSIPQMATIQRSQVRFSASYDGIPDFVPIPGTTLSHARNSSTPVIRLDRHHYFAVDKGVWFAAASPNGPWSVATSVPSSLYAIPSSSPLHYVTYVRIYGHADDVVYVGYTPGYYGTIVSNHVVVYGSGYACTPWIGSVWYGCASTYGTGAYFGYSVAVGWTFGFGWGYYTASSPWWGPYWSGYYPVAAYAPVAGAWNVYGQWGSAVVSGSAAAWANPWTGNYGRAAEGTYYNTATGGRGIGRGAINTNAYTGTTTAVGQAARYNPQTGRVVAGEGVAASNAYTGQSGVAGHSQSYNARTGRTTYAEGAAGRGPDGAAAAGTFHRRGRAEA